MALISVIMGVYNCETTLSDAIESIINQTYADWELIICDDGSQDNTYQVATKYANELPDKITVISNEKNLGLNLTLNKCLTIAKGEYIARMDGDDICCTSRFEEEIAVLKTEPNIAIVSSDMTYLDETGVRVRTSQPQYPTKFDFLKGTPFCHAPCMVRREAYERVGGYSVSKRLLRVEDYHLWIKMYKAGFRGENIGHTLYTMRDDGNAYSRRKFKYRINEAYVKYLAVKELKLPWWGYIYVLRPIVVGLLPKGIYAKLHKRS